eukprot:TRINITY_DN25679_c0_g1_i1.p1 TRINITY_DN25679_c0_g1~~TRINITY_DN25679_c0_g1_i1.p1  ORF type:complete len:230 (+),score=57.95 TRINITY_DN25679_c0_g1_i1:60-692(+)
MCIRDRRRVHGVALLRIVPNFIQLPFTGPIAKSLLTGDVEEIRPNVKRGLYGLLFAAFVLAFAILFFAEPLARLYSTDAALDKSFVKLRFLAAGLIITDFLKAYVHSILRALSLHDHAHQYLHFSYYMVGVVVILMLCFYLKLEIVGILAGILTGQVLFLVISYLEVKKFNLKYHSEFVRAGASIEGLHTTPWKNEAQGTVPATSGIQRL